MQSFQKIVKKENHVKYSYQRFVGNNHKPNHNFIQLYTGDSNTYIKKIL